jgi:hypothetical protein
MNIMRTKLLLIVYVAILTIQISATEVFSSEIVPGREVGEKMKVKALHKLKLRKDDVGTLKAILKRRRDKKPQLGEKIGEVVVIDKSVKLVTIIKIRSDYFFEITEINKTDRPNTYSIDKKPPEFIAVRDDEIQALYKILALKAETNAK